MARLIVFNIDTSSCKIGWSLPYQFKTQLNLLGYWILCESESLYLIRSMHDQNLLIPHTFYHITTTSRKFLYFMLFFIKTSWSCYERYYCPNYHIFCIISCCNSVPNNLWWLVHDTLSGLGPKYSVPILQYSSVLSTRTFIKYLYSYLYSSTFKNKSIFNEYLRVLVILNWFKIAHR